MRLKRTKTDTIKILGFVLIVCLIMAGAFGLFAAIYTATVLVLVIQMWMSKNEWGVYLNELYAMQKRYFPAMQEVARDIPRHSYIRYLNNGTLTEAYFRDCQASLQDEHLYIVISSTGSSSSELLSVFTRKDYNHASLSFDRDLKTIISYNGGGTVNPPGLNREQMEFFHQKEDASMLVYRLKAPKEKKQIVIDKIREINEDGSAYNLVGLVTRVSVKPNIMFCSQFVYSVLRDAGLSYFTEKAASVRPTDLIERDYYRKLEFCYAIKFNEFSTSIPA